MDIWFIYVIKRLLLPIASLLLLAFFGCLYVLKKKGQGVFLIIVPLLALFLLSLPVVSVFLAQTQQHHPIFKYSAQKKLDAQAIVVLSGGVKYFSPEYGSELAITHYTLERARYTAYLAKKTKLPILVSGGGVFKNTDSTEASILAAVLRDEFNVPVKWMEPKSRNTAENAIFSQKVLAENNVKHVVLVTHAMHMNRAVEQFRQVGLKVIPAPTALFSQVNIGVLSFLPSAHSLEISTLAIHEWMGLFWYRLRY